MRYLIVLPAGFIGYVGMEGAQSIIPHPWHWLALIPLIIVAWYAGRGAAA